MKQEIFNLNRKFNLFFWISLFFTFIYITYSFPSLSYHAEIYAELGTNFYPTARFGSLWENIWKTDAGYLPWLQRLIAVIVIKLLGLYDIFPYVCQFIGIGFISFFCSFINLFQFRKIIDDTITRFLISIILGLGVFSSYEEFTFINFTYYGIFFIVLSFFIDKEKFRTIPYILFLIFSMLLINSKAYFIVSAPLFGLHLIYNARKKNIKEAFHSLLMIFSIIIQIITMVNYRSTFRTDSMLKSMNYSELPMSLLNYLCSTILKVFGVVSNFPSYSFLIFPLVIIIVQFVYYIFKTKRYNAVKIFFICFIISIGSLTLSLLSISYLHWSKNFEIPSIVSNRHFFLSNYLIWLSIVIVFFSIQLKYRFQKQILAVLLFYVLFSNLSEKNDRDSYANHAQSYSQWNDYKVLLSYEDYCLPINPYPWMATNNCSEIPQTSIGSSNLRAIILEKNLVANNIQDYVKYIIALDQADNVLGIAYVLNTDTNSLYQYYLFKDRVSPHKLKYYTYNDLEVSMQNRKLKFYGASK